MGKVYLSYNTIVSPLGFDTVSNMENIANGISGIEKISDKKIFPFDFYASIIHTFKLDTECSKLKTEKKYTRLEKMMLLSLHKTILASKIVLTDKVGLIISTTKGNIDVLEENSGFPQERAYLATLGREIKEYFGFKNEAIVLSNACVSGLMAVTTAKKFIASGLYDLVFVVAGDIVSEFVVSGFNSFMAMSEIPCQPYSKNRNGISIGEAAASILVTLDKENLPGEAVEILGDGSCNDANHISGPSRTGEGLYRSVRTAMQEAHINPKDIEYISAHGTGTVFNDEMEAIAFNRLGLQNVPLNSLKGYFGHTTGASGLIETIVGMHSIHQNKLFASKGFTEVGVSKPLHIIEENKPHRVTNFLKTASGFGGSNTAAIFRKV